MSKSRQIADMAIASKSVVRKALRSSGQPLDAGTRGDMERRFGRDFSGVRTHTDPTAAASAQSLGASAYTLGENIVFGAGRYDQSLLAHELTHVVQQSAGGGPAPGAEHEAEADRVADAVTAGRAVPAISARSAHAVQRKVEMRDVGKGGQSGFARLDELVIRLNAISVSLVFAVSGTGSSQELTYTKKADAIPDDFDRQMMDFIDQAAVIPVRLTNRHGLLGNKVSGFNSPVVGDAWESGLADIDDMLASTDLGLQFLLVHLLAERTATRNYAKRVGDLGGAGGEFVKAHKAGIGAELALLRAFFGDPTIRLLSDVPSFPGKSAIGRTHINSRGDKIRLRVTIAGGANAGLNDLSIDVLTKDGKVHTADEYKKILEAAAAPAAAAAAPVAPAAAVVKPPIDLTYHPKFEPPDPSRLPPDFWKPLPPPPKGSEPKTVVDMVAEKLIDPVVDSLASKLGKDKRDYIKQMARSALKSGGAKAARAAAEAAGVTDKATLDAIEKSTEAALMEKGGPPK